MNFIYATIFQTIKKLGVLLDRFAQKREDKGLGFDSPVRVHFLENYSSALWAESVLWSVSLCVCTVAVWVVIGYYYIFLRSLLY